MKLSKLSDTARESFCKGFDLAEAGDVDGAIDAYLVAARLGDGSAQVNLATLLDDHANPRRPEEAVYWYKRGVRSGDTCAAWNLAIHYAGLGKRRWYLHWLEVAKSMGDKDAERELRSAHWWKIRQRRRTKAKA